MSNWLELKISAPDGHRDAITNFLFEIGCVGCREDPDQVTAYFSDDQATAKLKQQLTSYLASVQQISSLDVECKFSFHQIPDQDWNAEWKKHFKPVRVSRRFTVKPTWEPLPVSKTDFVLNIDPKQAFGTGGHATTAMMLQLMEHHSLADCKVLDVGTGSGILIIAAHILGAKQLCAFDIDPIATVTAHENAVTNLGQQHGIHFLTGGPQALRSQNLESDFILANLTRKVLLHHLDDFNRFSNSSATLLFSGILTEELDQFRESLSQYGAFKIRRELYREEWVAIELGKI